MPIMLKLCNFGTIYLWIFVWKVLHACSGYTMEDGGASGVAMLKPYPYQMFDYPDDLLHEQRNSLLGQTPTKHKQHPVYGRLHFALLPKTGSDFGGAAGGGGSGGILKEGRSMENLNDFDLYKIANAFWPLPKYADNDNKIFRQQATLRHRFPLLPLVTAASNILCETPSDTINRGKRQRAKDKGTQQTSLLDELRKEGDDDDGDNDNDDGDGETFDDDEDVKLSAFPLKDHDTSSSATVISNSVNGNGNENLNYSDNKEVVRNNYSTSGKEELVDNAFALTRKERKRGGRSRDKKPKQELNTPYLPAISGGSMVNLGKFFRDLSKNVQFSEKYHWSSEEQKLLEGDPIFGNLDHHLSDPHVTSDRAGEWIKAIRYYRPSQKIRSLVAMNPHGQWAHGSNFIDPNYMWMGLGK